jgi:hypothetical protein
VQSSQNPWYARVVFLVKEIHRLQLSLRLALEDAKNAPRSSPSRTFFEEQASKTRTALTQTKAKLSHAKSMYLEDEATVPEVRSEGLGSFLTDTPLARAEKMERSRRLARDRRNVDTKVETLQRALDVVSMAHVHTMADEKAQQALSDALQSAQQEQRKLQLRKES